MNKNFNITILLSVLIFFFYFFFNIYSSNILYPEEDKENKKLKLVCKKDGLEYDATTNCIYIHNFGEEMCGLIPFFLIEITSF